MAPHGRAIYSVLVGAVVGALVVGVVMPFAVEGRREETVAAAESAPSSDLSPGGNQPAMAEDPLRAALAGDGDGDGGRSASTSAEPSSPSGGPAATSSSSSAPPGGTIKIGILLLDIAGAASLGFTGFVIPSPSHQRRIWQTWIDERNRTGGVAGRTIEPVYRTFDALDQSNQRAQCLALTEDAQVFAVLESTSGYARDAVTCVTYEHATPLLTAATPVQVSHEIASRAGRFLFGLTMSATRTLTNAAVEWHNLGLLKGKRIGVLDLEGFTSTVDVGLLPKFRELGYEVKQRVIFSADQQTAATQVPTAALQMRNAGIDVVIMATDGLTGTQFVQEADAQRYHPQYLASDYIQYTQDFNTQNMPDAFDGAIAITAQRSVNLDRLPPNAAETRCQELYERASGAKIVRDQEGDYPFVMLSCAVLGYFADGAAKLTGELTRDSLSTAIQSLGPVEPPNFAPGNFRPGKFDAGDHVATMRWHGDCNCWRHQGGYRPATVR